MKKYAGEEFLNKIYKDLIHSDEVQFSAKGGNKNEDVSLYMDRLDRVTNKAIEHGHLNVLKKLYRDKYVIKPEDVPESYFESKKKRVLYQGKEDVEFTGEKRKREINGIISEQEISLDRWIDYFSSSEAEIYPTWFKYFCFQGMIRLGSFDKDKGVFSKRSKGTVKPFVELNAEAIAFIYEELVKVLDKRELNDREIEKILKSGSFSKIYAYIIQKLDSIKKDELKNENVKWKKYSYLSDPKELVSDLKDKGSGWCIARGWDASCYLKEGDIHIGYTQDNNGVFSNPRVAFFVKYGKVEEIKGILGLEQLEFEMLGATEKKLVEFPRKGNFPKRIEDLKKIKVLFDKKNRGEEFSLEELKFLYSESIESFGLVNDPRIDELKNGRDHITDLKRIVEGDKTGVFKGNIDLRKNEVDNIKDFNFPKIVEGDFIVTIKDFDYDDEVTLPEKVLGKVDVCIECPIKRLKLPKAGNSIFIKGLDNVDDLDIQEEVNGSLYILDEEITKEKVLPKKVDYLSCISFSVSNITFPKVVDMVNMISLKSAENTVFPEEASWVDLSSLEVVDNVIFPKNIKGEFFKPCLKVVKNVAFSEEFVKLLPLYDLEVAENVVFPKNDEYMLSELKTAKNVEFEEGMNGSIVFGENTSFDGIKLPEEMKSLKINITSLKAENLPRKLHYLSCYGTSAENLDLSDNEIVSLNFLDANNIDGFKFPKGLQVFTANSIEYIKNFEFSGDMNIELRNLKEADCLKLPEKKILFLGRLERASDLIFPKQAEYIDLHSLKSAEGLIIPDELDCEIFCPAFDNDLNLLKEAAKESIKENGRHM